MSEQKGFFSFLNHITFVDDDSSKYEIAIEDNGFSYLDMVSEKKAKRITFEQKQERETGAALDGSTRAHGKHNITKIDKIDHGSICFDTDLKSIIADVQARTNRLSLFPIASGGIALVIAMMLWVLPSFWGIALLPASLFAAFLLLWNVWRLDVSRKHANIKYSFSANGHAAFEAINSAVRKFSSSQQVLYYSGQKHFEDTRYSGGAQALPVFELVQLGQASPPLLALDMHVWHIRADHKDMYFLPDHLMVCDGGRIGGISYGKLSISTCFETTQARDVARKTNDCNVVDNTWRFVNNDGTPDQRFNNNATIPIVKYGVLQLSGPGLDMQFYTSLQTASVSAPEGFSGMMQLAKKPVVATSETRRQQAVGDICSSLLDAMCCIMVADGKVDETEKQVIQKVMANAKAPWDEQEINVRIQTFVKRVNEQRFAAVLQQVCQELAEVKRLGKSSVFLKCLMAVAKADGTVERAEAEVYGKFEAILIGAEIEER
jgi:uncharacterized tellurite resistance protein B-like protein